MLIYLLVKDGELKHTYSINKRDKLIEAGWNYVANSVGWNNSINYIKPKLT